MSADQPAEAPHTGGGLSLSRRRVLGAGLAATGTLLLAGGSAPGSGPRRRPVVQAGPPPAVTVTRPPPSPPPGPLPVLQRAVMTLDDYRKAVPGPAFPANAIALTIDDGPHPLWTPKVLRLLEQYHVPALFCLIGNQVLGHESVATSIVQAGHQVANHTWSHPATLPQTPEDQIRAQLQRAQDKIYSTTSATPTLFRSPGGAWSPAVYAAAAQARMVPLGWTEDPRDWTKPGTEAITNRLLDAKPGEILLCHDGGGDRSQTCAALRTVIPALQARGYQFVALDGRPREALDGQPREELGT
jgi:peptidoglycan/xylan/chitin deacetylase (PgdA/CDA1 family)